MDSYSVYGEKIRVDLTDLCWNEELWEKFIQKLCHKNYKIESGKMGEVLFSTNNGRISNYQVQIFVRTYVSEFLDEEKPQLPQDFRPAKKVQLPLSLYVDSVNYLSYSTRLAALQMVPEIAEWLLQYFINIKFIYRKESDDYFFFEEELEDVLDLRYSSYQEIKQKGDIITYLRKNLDSHWYVVIDLDEYYIPVKDYYKQSHHVNESLFFAYDDEKQTCMAYGFTRQQQMSVFTMKYEEIVLAYEKGKVFSFISGRNLQLENSGPVLAFRPRLPMPYQYTSEEFCKKLSEYLYPKKNELIQNDFYVYGCNVIKAIVRNLQGDTLSDFMDFRAINLLYEQKKSIRRRLQVLEIRYKMPEILQKLIQAYDQIIFAFMGIQITYLQQSMKESRLWNYEKRVADQAVRRKTAEQIEKYSREERTLLVQIKTWLEQL